jgi:pyruvate,water dikinase
MIDSVAGGVIYTRDPNNPDSDSIIINAIQGLGILLEDGNVTPDSYVVSRHPAGIIQQKKISKQEIMLVNNPQGAVEEVMISPEKRGKQCLADDQIKILARYSLDLEKHYGAPQDIEWTIDRDGRIYILQSRPLRAITQQVTSHVSVPTRFEGYHIILDKGVIACRGAGYGKAYILANDEDLKDFPEGAVLIANHTSPKFVTIMDRAAAIITDVGSATGHMASLAREYQVPTILDTEIATGTIKNGQEITVDAINCRIYDGKVIELLEYSSKKRETFKETRLYKTMEKVLDLIAPLNLVDPESEDFLQDSCKTFHDITRFAHETAMHEMFNIGEGQDVEGIGTIVLAAGVPMDAHLLDIDGGIKENTRKATPEDILSITFAAFLKGMKSMKWPEPKSLDVKGFLGMMAHTASIPEEDLLQMGKSSFCIVSKNYMNFSIRLGYHFSMVESYAGENIHDNYIKFFFKGGGATQDRRLRRVRLITEILREMGFRMNVKEDVINAIFPKYKEPVITARLEILGKLTVFTKQLDMVLFNDAITDMYIAQFIKDHINPSL